MDLIVLATRNEGKARELAALLAGLARRFESLATHPEVLLPPESEPSYRANALSKARAVQQALGVPALGDDSGLEVDALAGAPGLLSARYAGEGAGTGAGVDPAVTDRANNERLLRELAHTPADLRSARFRCALALVLGPGQEVVVEGSCEGDILDVPRGTGGFGYDPLFLPEGESRSFAELPGDVKDAISHRARAAHALREALGAARAGLGWVNPAS